MSKIIYQLLIFFSVSFTSEPCCAQIYEIDLGINPRAELNLKGNVKDIASQGFEAKMIKGIVTAGDMVTEQSYMYDFDKSGLIKEKTEFYKDGGLRSRRVYKISQNIVTGVKNYDAYGDYIQLAYMYRNSVLSKITYKDKDGKMLSYAEIITNEKGLTKEKSYYDSKGAKLLQIKNEIIGGVIIQSNIYDKLSKLVGKSLFKCNTNNDVEKFEDYDGEKLVHTDINQYEYDPHNNWVSKVVYNAKGIARYVILRKITYY